MYASRPCRFCLLGSRPRPKVNWKRLTKLLMFNLEQLLFVTIKYNSHKSKVVKIDETCSIAGDENPADNTSVKETVSVAST